MGLGVAVGRRRPELLHRTLPALAVLSIIFGAAEPLHLLHLSFPDSSVHLWGAEGMGETRLRLLLNLGIFLVLFAGIVGVFFLAGTSIGWLPMSGTPCGSPASTVSVTTRISGNRRCRRSRASSAMASL